MRKLVWDLLNEHVYEGLQARQAAPPGHGGLLKAPEKVERAALTSVCGERSGLSSTSTSMRACRLDKLRSLQCPRSACLGSSSASGRTPIVNRCFSIWRAPIISISTVCGGTAIPCAAQLLVRKNYQYQHICSACNLPTWAAAMTGPILPCHGGASAPSAPHHLNVHLVQAAARDLLPHW